MKLQTMVDNFLTSVCRCILRTSVKWWMEMFEVRKLWHDSYVRWRINSITCILYISSSKMNLSLRSNNQAKIIQSIQFMQMMVTATFSCWNQLNFGKWYVQNQTDTVSVKMTKLPTLNRSMGTGERGKPRASPRPLLFLF